MTTHRAPADPVGADLLRLLKTLKLGALADTLTAQDDLRYDRTLLGDLTSLRFLEAGQSAIILGPVGVGKTHLATALGHMAIRRRHTVLFAAPTSCSPACAPPAWTTPSTPRSAG